VLTRGCEIFGGRPEHLTIEPANRAVPPALLETLARRAAYPA
jgi:hypothetical protein